MYKKPTLDGSEHHRVFKKSHRAVGSVQRIMESEDSRRVKNAC